MHLPTLCKRLLAALGLALLACSEGEPGVAAPETRSAEQVRSPEPGSPEVLNSVQEQLAALGYVASEPLHERTGVTLHDPARAQEGWNLIVSQHGQEARLLDMCGETLHLWGLPQAAEGKGAATSAADEAAHGPANHMMGLRPWWRTVHLFPNGDLLAQTDFGPLAKLDRDSRVLWQFEDRTHHDFDVRDDGHIFVLTAKPGPFPGFGKVLQDFIVELDPRGRELRRVSILQALVDGGQTEILAEIRRSRRNAKGMARLDVTHTNALEILDGSLEAVLPAFRGRNLLISVPTIGRLMVVDFDAGRVVWSLDGSFVYQHHPTMLDNGHLLLFDNKGLGERSRALELDPATGKEVWSYGGSDADRFFSKCCGRVHRLPNGNTLVVESQPGRAFEVTGDGTIVWGYHSPHEVQGRVAILNDVVRIAPDQASWVTPEAAGGR